VVPPEYTGVVMYVTETTVRVRYGETDRMGYVYYGVYAAYYEVARVEALRALGTSYRQMEDSGLLLPVRDYSIRYYHPAFYDDQLLIKTTIPELPSARIRFLYESYNESGTLINSGTTTLVFVQAATGKPCPAPDDFLRRLKGFFSR
jgi:acyl-CoA thioester hydrolase